MSLLRKIKAKLNFYKIPKNNLENDNFYEFILNDSNVTDKVEKYGFELMLKHYFDATKGIKDEIPLLKPILQKIYDCQNDFAKGIRLLISILFSRTSGHMILLIFQKK